MSRRGIRWNKNDVLRYKQQTHLFRRKDDSAEDILAPPTACTMTPFSQKSRAASKLPLHMCAVRSQLTLHLYIRFEFFTTHNTKFTDFWNVMPGI